MSHLKQFLLKYSIDDVKQPISGELPEYSTNEVTYCFGNGFLYIFPADESQLEQVYVVDNVRGFDELLRISELI